MFSSVIYPSNSFDQLVERLFSQLSLGAGKQLILVSSRAMKEEIYRRAVLKWGVALGFKVLDLASGVEFLTSLVHPDWRSLSFPCLSLVLEKALRSTSEFFDFLEEDEWGMKGAALSDRLAQLFLKYSLLNQQKMEGWQQELWDELHPLFVAPSIKSLPYPMEIHVFAIPFLSPRYQTLLKHLEAQLFFYPLSPSSAYWSDCYSDRETIRLKKEKEADAPPLLVNYGRLSRAMADFYMDLDGLEFDSYVTNEAKTLLSSLKRDLVEFTREERAYEDDSLQIHSSPSRAQEVEGIKKTLVQLLHDDPTLKPTDILCVAPDIERYAPYIERFFENVPFSAEVKNLPLKDSSPLFQALEQLLKLSQGRFEKKEILSLLKCEPFCSRFGFSHEDTRQICSWMERVKWGFDGAHVEKIIGQPLSATGTWRHTFDHLLYSLAMTEGEGLFFPMGAVSLSQGPLLGKWIALVEQLYIDFERLQTSHSIEEWMGIIVSLINRYLYAPEDPGFSTLSEAIAELSRLDCGEALFSFRSIQGYLAKFGERKSGTRFFSSGPPIQFCSLRAGHLCSRRVIIAMGMEAEAFPRARKKDPLQQLSCFPSQADEDREACLQLLLFAEDKLILSFVSQSPEDGKEVEPSSFIEDVRLEVERKTGRPLEIAHPAIPFHFSYFSGNRWPRSFSLSDFKIAQAYYGKAETTPEKTFAPAEPLGAVSIAQLNKLMKSSARFFCHERLGVYLKEEESDELSEFILSGLDYHQLRRRSTEIGVERALEEAQREGILPEGIFGEKVRQKLAEEDVPVCGPMIHLEIGCREPLEQEGDWILPPLQWGDVLIHGSFEKPTAPLDFASAYSQWPSLLVWSLVSPTPFIEKDFAGDALSRLIAYSKEALSFPSPLSSTHAALLLKGEKGEFEKKMNGRSSYEWRDPHLVWIGDGEWAKLEEKWKKPLELYFEPLIRYCDETL